MTSISQRLKEQRNLLSLNQTDFAAIGGVTKKTQMIYEKGTTSPTGVYLSAIAAAGADVNYILTGNKFVPLDAPASEHVPKEMLGSRLASEKFKTDITARFDKAAENSLTHLPYLDIEASAGHGSIVEHEETTFMVAFDRDWLRREVGVSPQHLRLIKARGDSMDSGKGVSGDIYDGDILLVDTSVERMDADAAYIIQFDGHLVVKRIQKMFDGSISIISSNPEYATQSVPSEQASDIRISGKVVYMIAGRRV